MSETPTKLNKTEATQGKTGVGLRYVLIGGLVLVIIAFVIVWLVQ